MIEPDSSHMAALASASPAFTGPRTFGEILDRIFQLLRKCFFLLVGVASVPGGACLALYALMAGLLFAFGGLHPNKGPDSAAIQAVVFPVVLLASIPMMAVFALFMAAASYAATQADGGVRCNIRDAYRMAWGRAGRHILLLPWIYLRAFLPTILIVVVTLAGVALLSVVKGAGVNSLAFLPVSLGMLLYIAAYVYGIVIALRLSLAFPASVVEGLTARNAMRRSSQLTKGAKGRIFLMLLLIYAISYAFLFAFYLVAIILFAVGAVAASVLHLQLTAPWSFLGEGFLGICVVAVIFLWITLTWAGLTTALAVIYHDQRVRLEGYDVERMMEAAGMSAPKTSPSGASLAEPGAEGVEN